MSLDADPFRGQVTAFAASVAQPPQLFALDIRAEPERPDGRTRPDHELRGELPRTPAPAENLAAWQAVWRACAILRAEGVSVSAIARATGVSWKTGAKLLAMPDAPDRAWAPVVAAAHGGRRDVRADRDRDGHQPAYGAKVGSGRRAAGGEGAAGQLRAARGGRGVTRRRERLHPGLV